MDVLLALIFHKEIRLARLTDVVIIAADPAQQRIRIDGLRCRFSFETSPPSA